MFLERLLRPQNERTFASADQALAAMLHLWMRCECAEPDDIAAAVQYAIEHAPDKTTSESRRTTVRANPIGGEPDKPEAEDFVRIANAIRHDQLAGDDDGRRTEPMDEPTPSSNERRGPQLDEQPAATGPEPKRQAKAPRRAWLLAAAVAILAIVAPLAYYTLGSHLDKNSREVAHGETPSTATQAEPPSEQPSTTPAERPARRKNLGRFVLDDE